jgi:hypothetical protein
MNRAPGALALIALTTLAALAGPSRAGAQTPGYGPTVLDVVTSPRTIALGGSWAVNAGTPDLLFANPALISVFGSRGDRGAGLLGSMGRWGGEGSAASLAGGGEWFGGGIALGARAFEADDGAPLGSPSEGESQWAGTVGYGREVLGVHLGASATLFRARVQEVSSTGGSFDVGAAAEAFDIMFSLAATNLGPDMSLDGEKIPLPYRITLAANSERTWVGPFDIGGAAAVAYRADGEWIPSAGIEVAWWPVVGRTFVGRAGYRRVPTGTAESWTVGAAFEGDRLGLEWAYQPYDGSAPGGADYPSAHFLGIRWR